MAVLKHWIAVFSLLAAYSVFLTYGRVMMTGLSIQASFYIENGIGEVVYIRGTNRMKSTWCAFANSAFDGPSDNASIQALISWNINTVRLPLNEFCWLNLNGVTFGGLQYQEAIEAYVQLLYENGIAVILSLAMAGPGNAWDPTNIAAYMPNNDHSPTFWQEVSFTFQNYSNVMYDLYDSPYPEDGIYNSSVAWGCWQLGDFSCPYESSGFQAVGMTSLLATIRANSKQIVWAAGIGYGNGLSEWTNYVPHDRTAHQIAAVIHVSSSGLQSYCNTPGCWTNDLAPIVGFWPLMFITFDLAQSITQCTCQITCQGPNFGFRYNMHMVVGYWDANAYCDTGCLITNFNGTATATYGTGYQQIINGEVAEGY